MSFHIIRCYILIAGCTALVLMSAAVILFENRFIKIKAFLEQKEKVFVWIVLAIGFSVYMISIIGYMGVEKFVKDFDVFLMWSKMLLDDGLKGFMTEYPPIGLYILAAIQWFLRLFGLGDHYLAALLTMKMPSILASLCISYIGYKWAKKEGWGINSLFIMIAIAFNPAFIINASMWGQMDMLMILIAVVSFYFLKFEKYAFAVIMYTLGCLVKPQMIFFAPIFGMFAILPMFDKDKRKKHIKKIIPAVIISVGVFFIAALPFKEKFTDLWIVEFFTHISSEHPVNTASAFNLFGLHGGSFKPYTNSFLFADYKTWGYIFIGIICAACVFLVLKDKKRRNIFLLSAFCMAAVFTLGVSMHERYVLSVAALIGISYIFTKNKHALIAYILYSLLGVINQSIILFDLFGGKDITFRLFSGVSVIVFIYFAVYVIVDTVSNKNVLRQE